MFLPFLFITTTLTITIFTFLITILTKKTTKHPPGPKGLPLIGNIHQINPLTLPHLYFTQLSKTYGPILYLKLGFTPLIVISSPKLAKHVLKSKDHLFCGRNPTITQRKLSYNGLDIVFSPPNTYWRELRKICMIHLFSSKQVETFSSIRREELKWIFNGITTLSSSSSKAVNVNEMVMSTIVSIICRVGFGKMYSDEEKYKRGSEFYCLLKSAQDMFMTSFLSDYLPLMSWMDWLNGSWRRLEKVYKELDEFYEELIKEHVDVNRVKCERKDIIDVLLELRQQGGIDIELTFDHIKAVLMNIFIAGTETTAGTIVWAMTYLMKNPNTMNKVQVEIRAFTKKNKEYETFIQEEDIQHLPYLQAIVKETLRIHPVVPLLVPHSSLEKCTLDGYEIEAGTLVFVNAWAIGRDPESWKDPDLFLPERFLNSYVNFKGQDFEFIPFGAGRRICPGLVMGATTVEVVLANLLCWFDWEMPDGVKREDIDLDVLPGISTLKKNALCLYAKNVVKS